MIVQQALRLKGLETGQPIVQLAIQFPGYQSGEEGRPDSDH